MTPARLIRLTAFGFAIGSTLFAVGVPVSLVDGGTVAADRIFFAGSVFFTLAAAGQLLTSARHLPAVDDAPARSTWRTRLARPRTMDWTASAVQFFGTLEFNVTTLLAVLDAAGHVEVATSRVWRPDALGSVAFLVASALAAVPEVRRRRHAHVRTRSWWIAALNLLGSALFGLSALGAFTTSSGDLVSLRWANTGTFLGALCFLAGALLLLPPRRVTGDGGPAASSAAPDGAGPAS